MLNTKEKRQLDTLLKKQAEPIKTLTEDDLSKIEDVISDVYDRSPELFGDGLTSWRKFCSNLEVIASQNDSLVIEVRRLNKVISDIKSEQTQEKV